MGSILVAGGARDPNLIAIVEALQSKKIDILPLLIAEGDNPSLCWDPRTDKLALNNKPLNCSAVFYRRDVFNNSGSDAGYRALAWFTVIQGWLTACRRQVRVLNRAYIGKHTNKLHVLRMAHNFGLPIPTTLISNNIRYLETLNMVNDTVAKPVTGGGYCKPIEEVLSETEFAEGIAAAPAIVQRKLAGPDIRIYGIDNTFIGFRIHADKIDYRETRNRNIELVDSLPLQITELLKRLMTAMGLDWCAADFKSDPETGQLTFLEINSNPMFSVFDKIAQGRITDAIAGFLTK